MAESMKIVITGNKYKKSPTTAIEVITPKRLLNVQKKQRFSCLENLINRFGLNGNESVGSCTTVREDYSNQRNAKLSKPIKTRYLKHRDTKAPEPPRTERQRHRNNKTPEPFKTKRLKQKNTESPEPIKYNDKPVKLEYPEHGSTKSPEFIEAEDVTSPESIVAENPNHENTKALEPFQPNTSSQLCRNESVDYLVEQMDKAVVELFWSMDHNYTLKRELALVSTVAKREITEDLVDFADLARKSKTGEWVGRHEIIVDLRRKIRNLIEVINHQEAETNFKAMLPLPAPRQLKCLSEKEKMRQRLGLERSIVMKNMKREKNKILQSNRMMESKLIQLSQTNDDLKSECDFLRNELFQAPSVINDILAKQIREMKVQTKRCLSSKAQLAKSLEAENLRTQQYYEMKSDLENEISSQMNELTISEDLLKLLSSKQESMYEYLEKTRMEAMDCSRYFKSFLEDLNDCYMEQNMRFAEINNINVAPNRMSLESVRQSMDSGYSSEGQGLSDASKSSSIGDRPNNGKVGKKSRNYHSGDDTLTNVWEDLLESVETCVQGQLNFDEKEIRPITVDDILGLKTSYDEIEEANLDSYVVSSRLMDEIQSKIKKFLKSESAIARGVSDIDVLKLRLQLLQKSESASEPEDNLEKFSPLLRQLKDSGQHLLSGLENEKKFLKNCINRLIFTEEEDLDFYINGISKIGDLFVTNLDILFQNKMEKVYEAH